jgi:hypothetical protein
MIFQSETIADLLGPVETQYAVCSGCDTLQVTLQGNVINQVQITAPDCEGQITGFQFFATGQGLAGDENGQSFFVPVGSGSFAGNVWSGNPGVQLSQFGDVMITCDVVNADGSTGPLCETTVFNSLRE